MSSASAPSVSYGIQSTAGAIPIRNEKGELSMQKVKVQRYISGKRPEYATYNSSGEESEEEDFIDNNRKLAAKGIGKIIDTFSSDVKVTEAEDRAEVDDGELADDPRLRRLQSRTQANDEDREEDRYERHRHIHEPEILDDEEESESENEMGLDRLEDLDKEESRTRRIRLGGSDSESDGELSDSEIEKRRQMLRFKMLQQQKEEEILVKEDEKEETSDSESEATDSESEEESDAEDNEPRLKPLFVRKRDRTTIIEKEKEDLKKKQQDYELKKLAKERRRQTLRLVEESVKKDLEKVKVDTNEPNINDVCTDDENDEVEYEAWKLRELKRIKRDRDEKEGRERDQLEVDRLRNMTEEERRQDLRLNPKQITNKASKGKYKFLQKYFHRGAFYLDEENDVFKRDFSEATLEDHFDKSILPKVMQVKNFGRCGRTKYTHLTDQDTTDFKSPWFNDTANNLKFHYEKAGGTKQVNFDKPGMSSKRRKPN